VRAERVLQAVQDNVRSASMGREANTMAIRLLVADDHALVRKGLARRLGCTVAEIGRDERKGEKASDHAPVLAVFAQ
jgi:exonuclease III